MKKKPQINNFVAKHAQSSGAGTHKPKKGKGSYKRVRVAI